MDKRRTYVQTARAASTQATRDRILEAAEASFERGPLAAVKIAIIVIFIALLVMIVLAIFRDRSRRRREEI